VLLDGVKTFAAGLLLLQTKGYPDVGLWPRANGPPSDSDGRSVCMTKHDGQMPIIMHGLAVPGRTASWFLKNEKDQVLQ